MKKILFSKSHKIYRIIPFIIVFSIFISSIPSVALTTTTEDLKKIELSSGETVMLSKQQLDDIVEISQSEATAIALGFIRDMITAGITEWNEKTEIVDIIPMYDNTNSDTVTAYTFNLTQGYVVISAFLDTKNLIPEWSDKSEPLYKSINANSKSKIIYLGLYEYYIEASDNKAVGLGNITIDKSQITDNITPTRSIENIPVAAFNSNIKKNSTKSTTSETIGDPESDAYNYTSGPFVIRQTVDYWGEYMPYYTYSYGLMQYGYNDCCAAVAFTNFVSAYKSRYSWAGNELLRGFSNDNQIFNDIRTYLINNGYYVPGFGTSTRSRYISELLNRYAMWSNYYYYSEGTGIGSYEALYSHLQDNRLIDIALNETHDIYGNGRAGHEIICHGVTRFQSTTTNAYISYMHIADGWGISTRYITVASAMYNEAVSVDFLWV